MGNDIYRLDEKINGDDSVDIIDYTNKLAESIQKKIDDIIMSGDTNTEVVDARGEFETLGKRLNNVDKNIIISTKPFETDCFIEDSANSKIKFDKIIGGLVQEGEPSIANPSELKYVGGSYEIWNSNKNLIKITDMTFVGQGVTSIVKNGLISCNGVTTQKYFDIGNSTNKAFKTNILANTNYVFSVTKSFEYNLNIRFYAKNGDRIKDFVMLKNETSILINIPKNSDHCYMWFSNFEVGTSISIEQFSVQIEKDTIAKDYIKHEGEILPLDLTEHSLYSANDYIYKIINKWFAHNEWNRIVLDGTTNKFKYKSSTTKNNQYGSYPIDDILKPESNNIDIKAYSNYFNSTSSNNIYLNNIEGISIDIAGSITIGFGLESGINTLELANAKLQELYNAGTPVEIIYPLATPTETEIQGKSAVVEAELLYTQLEALANMKTYKGGTHITFDDLAKLQGEYVVDNGLAEAVQEFNEINGYVDEARVIELIKQYK